MSDDFARLLATERRLDERRRRQDECEADARRDSERFARVSESRINALARSLTARLVSAQPSPPPRP